MERVTLSHRNLWGNIEARLDLGPVRWRGRIESLAKCGQSRTGLQAESGATTKCSENCC